MAKKLNHRQIVGRVRRALLQKKKMLVAVDADGTVVKGDDNPFRCQFYEKSARALQLLSEHGHIVAVITNRGGAQIARMMKATLLKISKVIGTFGHEYRSVDTSRSDMGEGVIDEEYSAYQDIITLKIRLLRERLFRALNVIDPGLDAEVELQTEWGPLFIEQKGVCAAFPFGLGIGFNANFIKLVGRPGLIALIEGIYQEVDKYVLSVMPNKSKQLLKLWGLVKDPWSPGDPGRYSIKFEPLTNVGKYQAMKNLLAENPGVEVIIVTGDTDDDGYMMIAAKEYAAEHMGVQAFCIWVDSGGKPQQIAAENADYVVSEVEGLAVLLNSFVEELS